MRQRRFLANWNESIRPGFTLVETMVALVMAGIMISLAIPRVDASRYRADAVAQIVRTTLQNASRTAVTRQHDMIVSFDTLAERLTITWDKNNDGVLEPTERVTNRGLDTGILFADPAVLGVSGEALASPITGTAVATINGLPSLTFHRDGSVSSDAEIYVSIAARNTTPYYRAIVLTQATGRVDWYRLNTSTNKWVIAGL